MSTTTYTEIRSWMRSALIARAPATFPGLGGFTPWTAETDDFGAWAESAAAACFRRFDIRHGFDEAFIAPHDLVGYLVQHSAVVLVAYPLSPARYGDQGQADGEDLIAEDLLDVDKAVGQTSSRAGWPAGLCDSQFVGAAIEDRPGVRIRRLLFQLTYNRSIPS